MQSEKERSLKEYALALFREQQAASAGAGAGADVVRPAALLETPELAASQDCDEAELPPAPSFIVPNTDSALGS